ncbi:hypothetical protein [Streptomyces sp. NPDC001820]|uniref:hypothetical protein n=1 Tax=Streptomyces sp. NPDC001820 TaxID=3364613 RepID=UPI0036B8DEF6
MTRYRFDVDFGFSDLTRWFQGPWQHERTVPETVSDACEGRLGWPEGVAATAILHDSLRLLESPLSTAEITALWQAATQGGYNLEYFGIDGRDWLRQIVEICTDRLRQVDAAYAAVVEWPAPASSAADAVLAALRAASASLEAAATSGHRPTVPGIVEALEKTVVQVDPDLGFRLFLRIMAAYWVPITEAEYARYAALGERFGYGEFHVDDVEFLTRLKGD